MFIWTDFETTGLDPANEEPLALGLIITDNHFREIARREWVIKVDPENPALVGMAPFVREMHTKNGLLERLQYGQPRANVEEFACSFLDRYVGRPAENIKERPPMAGNSIEFDMAFMRWHFPELARRFNYRLLNVSTLKLLACATVPGAQEWNDSRPEAKHTPLDDLDNSIAELAHWRHVLRTSSPTCPCGSVLPHGQACVFTTDPEAT